MESNTNYILIYTLFYTLFFITPAYYYLLNRKIPLDKRKYKSLTLESKIEDSRHVFKQLLFLNNYIKLEKKGDIIYLQDKMSLFYWGNMYIIETNNDSTTLYYKSSFVVNNQRRIARELARSIDNINC
ncbi:MAG: hypothetical protein B6226_01200 [Candidatus Cloacimonetes bacterium 4572_65]|nr:MAG: hypothetical protein B6226_01200 [Candidatus Cloacimonetes bacterium 4572_65]